MINESFFKLTIPRIRRIRKDRIQKDTKIKTLFFYLWDITPTEKKNETKCFCEKKQLESLGVPTEFSENYLTKL